MNLKVELSKLIDDLKSEDVEIVKVACTEAAFLLERHTQKRYEDATYRDLFSQYNLFDCKLSEEEFDKIVDHVANVLECNKECASTAAWAIGKAQDNRLSKNLLDSLKRYLANEDDEVVYQIIISLENCGINEAMPLIKEVSENRKLIKSSEYAQQVMDLLERK